MVSLRPRKNSMAKCSRCGQLPQPMTRPPIHGCSSLFRSGGSRSSWCIGCAGLTAKPADGWSSRRSPGARPSTTLPIYTGASWRSGRRSCRGWKWRAPSGPVGTRYTIPPSTSLSMGSLIVDSTRSRPLALMKSSIVKAALSDLAVPDRHPRRRLLWIGEGRTKKTLDDGFTELEQEHLRKQESGRRGVLQLA